MKWFYNMSIRKKLFLSYAVLGLISLVIGVAGYMGTKQVMAYTDETNTVTVAQMRLLAETNTALLMARGDIRVSMYTKADDRREKYLKSTVDYGNKVVKLLDEFGQTPLESDQVDSLRLLQSTWKRYLELREAPLALIREKKDDDAQPMMDGEVSQTMIRSRTLLASMNKQLFAHIAEQGKAANAAVARSEMIVLFILLVGIVITTGFAIVITRIISTPVRRGMEMMQELSKGNLGMRMNLETKDEIGELTQSMDHFANTLHSVVTTMYRISEGELDADIKKLDAKDEITPALDGILNSLRDLVGESTRLTEAAVNGDLSARGDSAKFKGGYRAIVDGVNATLDKVILPVTEGSAVLQRMAQGDLTVRVKGDFKGDHQIIKNSINQLAESLNTALNNVSEAVAATASASNEISSSTEEMAAGAREQTLQTAEVSGAIDEMTKTIMDTSKNASLAATTAREAGNNAKEGGRVMMNTIDGMNRIADVVKRSAETVEALGRSSDQIGEIIQVIDDIADQTNLLALNAAIEAARAGEQGRGFAVVADEVRKLAERTTKATKEIAVMIRQIQKDTANAVESMHTGTDEVEHGKAMADKAGASLKEIIAGAEKVVDVATQVAAASEEQSSAAEEIGKNIEAIANVTAESASGTQQIAHAAEDLSRLTQNLYTLLRQFVLEPSSSSAIVPVHR